MRGKFCWLAKQEKKGWRLYLCLGERLTFRLRPSMLFTNPKDIEKTLKGNIVFVYSREKKEK